MRDYGVTVDADGTARGERDATEWCSTAISKLGPSPLPLAAEGRGRAYANGLDAVCAPLTAGWALPIPQA